MTTLMEPPMTGVMEPFQSGQKAGLGPASNYAFSPPFNDDDFVPNVINRGLKQYLIIKKGKLRQPGQIPSSGRIKMFIIYWISP